MNPNNNNDAPNNNNIAAIAAALAGINGVSSAHVIEHCVVGLVRDGISGEGYINLTPAILASTQNVINVATQIVAAQFPGKQLSTVLATGSSVCSDHHLDYVTFAEPFGYGDSGMNYVMCTWLIVHDPRPSRNEDDDEDDEDLE
eukprot:TRINITY_DN7755_c0_g1_i1.p1 TRINITY_DN7755_c0_g1~~TRINITY_DN7755_c0_g1_i1.p1  ORF type:complete len:144 (-),score=28.63 TRINITY_DN7755_c0_g1_i1:132-563(-)